MNAVAKEEQQLPENIVIPRMDAGHGAAATNALQIANSFQVVDPDTADMAANELRTIVAKKRSLEEERTKITKPINEALRAVNALFKKPTELLEQAERILKSKLITYQDAEDKKRREAQAKAEAAARAEAERLQREAAKLEAKGKVEQAAAKREIAQAMPMPVVAAAEKTGGFSARKNWKARTKGETWKRDLIAFVHANPAFDYLLDLNEQKANGLAKQCEKTDLGIPGLEGFNDQVGSIR